MTSRTGLLIAAVAALATTVAVSLVALGAMGADRPGSFGAMTRGVAGMGQTWLPGDGSPVASMEQARDRAEKAAASAGLHAGEVMWFERGFYVELEDRSSSPATEVLVDPRTGRVSTEPGPASMWNTDYGMHRRPAGSREIAEPQARRMASAWLADNRPGRTAGEADAYPGYFTFHVDRGSAVTGMLSVNAGTGRVWYHTWHGRLIDMDAG